MLLFQIHPITSWNDYFTGSPTNYNSRTYDSRHTPSVANVHISNCLFRSMTSGSEGGALYCSSSVSYLLVESTSFFSCKTSAQYGGAIYFSNDNAQSVLHEVCGYDCCSTPSSGSGHYQFAYISVNNAISSKNYANYSSIIRCINQISNSHHMSCLRNGNIRCPSVNMSMNKCPYVSGITLYPYADSNSITCSLTYCSITDNNAPGSICIHLWTGSANFEIKSCNVIRNIQNNLDSRGIFYTCGYLKIKDSCILENIATYIFYAYDSSTITLLNCTVDSTTRTGSLKMQNTVTKSFILALNHMSNLICQAEYDVVGYLSPIIQTPSPSKKQKLYCSCENFFYQCQLRFFFSLLGVFLFNFIHIDPSSYPLY
jgi:hypothetical protein